MAQVGREGLRQGGGLRQGPEKRSVTGNCRVPYDWNMKVKLLVAQWCPTLCNPMDWSPPGPSVRGILQARMLV